jgi:hypothetical protein
MSEKEIREGLSIVIKEEAIDAWLKKPNKSFEGRTPQELIDEGDFEPLRTMIWQLQTGMPS